MTGKKPEQTIQAASRRTPANSPVHFFIFMEFREKLFAGILFFNDFHVRILVTVLMSLQKKMSNFFGETSHERKMVNGQRSTLYAPLSCTGRGNCETTSYTHQRLQNSTKSGRFEHHKSGSIAAISLTHSLNPVRVS